MRPTYAMWTERQGKPACRERASENQRERERGERGEDYISTFLTVPTSSFQTPSQAWTHSCPRISLDPSEHCLMINASCAACAGDVVWEALLH